MSNTINIPVQLRPLTGGREHIKVQAETLRELLGLLEMEAPGVNARLLDQDGKLRRFVNVFIDGQDCRTLQDKQIESDVKKFDAEVHQDDQRRNPLNLRLTGYEEITILPALAGG